MPQSKTIIVGVGNTYRKDDGFGPAIIKKLHQEDLPKKINLLDLGTNGFALVDLAQQYSKIIIIDAVNMQSQPGDFRIFSLAEAKIKIKSDALSTHGFGLSEVLKLLETLAIKPDLKIVGIQPQDISFGQGLSNEVNHKIPLVLKEIKILIS
jgi:hydrogenase maturation protease